MVIQKKATENDKNQKIYRSFVEGLGLQPKKIELYILSFIHRSIVNERPDFAPEHNERLEFLGDAVLELVITHKLFLDFPDKPEGELTDIRSALVRGRNLALISKRLNLNSYLLLWNGEQQSGGAENNYILANTLEAFLWAIYMDLGYKEVEAFVLTHIYSTLDHILEKRLFKDAKSSIQEFVQAEYEVTPTYRVLSEEWPDHNKVFTVGVYMNETCLWVGKGSSKKKAEEQAAEIAYISITQD